MTTTTTIVLLGLAVLGILLILIFGIIMKNNGSYSSIIPFSLGVFVLIISCILLLITSVTGCNSSDNLYQRDSVVLIN
jgi:F0F1-type ATP synthase membrane subunit a